MSKLRRIPKRRRCAVLSLLLLTSGCGVETQNAAPCKRTKPAHRSIPPATNDAVTNDPVTNDDHAPPVPKVSPVFTNVAERAGIRFRRYDDIRGQHRVLEALGGGVALLDYDNDGRLDLFLPNGCKLPLKTDDRSHPGQLYHNRGTMEFAHVSAEADLRQFGYCHGTAVADYNNDGFDDLYVTAFGRNTLWMNNGDGTFSDVTPRTNTAVPQWSSSAAFADVNHDGILDLYVANYLQTGDDPPRLCPSPESPDGYVQCPPELFKAAQDGLLLGDGQGGFENVTQHTGIVRADGKGLGVAIFDTDFNGTPDIYVANDGTPNFLFVKETTSPEDASEKAPPRFREVATARGCAVNERGEPEAGMGVTCGDYDRDGWPDLYLTHFYRETNTMYRNLQGKGFLDVTATTGLGGSTRQMLGFGTTFFDYDNDGWLDLFSANGHIDDRRWAGLPWHMPPQLFRNTRTGGFRDVSRWAGSYFQQKWLGRGVAVGDLDDDGKQDLVVSNQRAPLAVLHNRTRTGNRVSLELVGRPPSNRSAIGARVELSGWDKPLVREVIGGGSYLSTSDRRIHLGLGDRRGIPTLKIYWPSGRIEEWPNVPRGSYLVIEGQGLLTVPGHIVADHRASAR